jgi:hypothetical protein
VRVVGVFYILFLISARGDLSNQDMNLPQVEIKRASPSDFKTKPVIYKSETLPDAQGQFQRVQVFETDFKYPLIRIEETIRKDATTGAEQIIQSKSMVADHFLVKVKKGTSEESFHQWNQKHGVTIRKKMLAPDTYILSIPKNQVEAFPSIVALYAAEKKLIEFAEPDYLAQTLGERPQGPQTGGMPQLQ